MRLETCWMAMVSAVVLTSVVFAEAPPAPPPLEEDKAALTKVGDAVPHFSFKTLDGQTLTPASLKGKVVLINFFATWCAPCNEEIPHLKKVYEKYKDKPFVMVSVSREEKENVVKSFVKKHKLDYNVAADPKRKEFNRFATTSIPRNYVIDPTGKIAFQSMGYTPESFDQLLAALDKEIEKAKPAK